jgi:poly(3-hydroxybutyrate) depolymerase
MRRLTLLRLSVAILAALVVWCLVRGQPSAAGEPRVRANVTFSDCLVVGPVGRSARAPLHRDPIEAQIVTGTWSAPRAGDVVSGATGPSRSWTPLKAAPDGGFSASALEGGYAFMSVEEETTRVMLLDAAGHSMVYVNGEPRTGDPYETRWARLPVLLRAGKNELLFHVARGRLRARLVAPGAPALLETRDTTLPDLIVGESIPTWGAVVVTNATTHPLSHLTLRAAGAPLRPAATELPPIPPLSLRKVPFHLVASAGASPGSAEILLALSRAGNSQPIDTAKLRLRVRRPEQTQKRTFISEIDGSVQYYAVNPASRRSRSGLRGTRGKEPLSLRTPGSEPQAAAEPPPALFLSLHGAGGEAIGQADAYESKSWGDLVAPTNRRPYGFDWEDWGRLDALEVLDLAQKRLRSDPQRIYLTGHSMGGHGAWHLGVTFPDRFAAIGPSAGWISFASYARGAREEETTPMQQMLSRAALPSDTLALASNLAQEGVYILHGDADDNVPVAQARRMSELLRGFHHDFVLFEQPGAGHWWDASDEPGADCVDWAPMFDFFARHAIPREESLRQVEFATADPGVSARSHWLGIEAQIHPLQLSSARIRYDPGRRRFVGTTSNVARLSLRVVHLPAGGSVRIELDGQKLGEVIAPRDLQPIWLTRAGAVWRVAPAPSPLLKGPERCGPFKQAFRHRVQLVYGTTGTAEENAWAFAKARYDAETFWYRGNGALEILADTAFDPARDRDRSVVLYGNAETNAAWRALLGASPVKLRRGAVQVGDRQLAGAGLACLFLRPRPGSRQATVGVVGGTGLAGMRLTDRISYFVSGVEYPDLIVLGPETLSAGGSGVRVAGFFGLDWGVATGELVWGP